MATRTTELRPDRGDVVDKLARFGLLAEGVLYAVIGLLAIDVAQGDRREEAGSSGAIETVASQPYGQWLLGVLTVGFFAMAAWRLLQAANVNPSHGGEASDRVKFGITGVIFVGLGVAALSTLLANLDSGGSGGSSSASQQKATSVVLDWPAGRWLVAFAGLAVIGFGLVSLWKNGVHAEFDERLGAMSEPTERAVVGLGRAGYVARGLILAIVGIFLMQAAITYDASEAKGLSGSIRSLADDGLGQLLLWAIAIGLFCFGLYKLAAARFRQEP